MANLFSSEVDGILAALLSPFFMSLGFFIWDSRWTASRASAFALNMYKCNVASIGFIIMCLVRGFESTASADANANNGQSVFTITSVGFLILSSTLGIIVGDVLWLEALRVLGAKHVIVIDSLKPFMAAILGWVALDEELLLPAWGGMALTVLGVGAVAWEEQRISASQGNINEKDGQYIAQNENDVEKTATTDRIEFSNEEEATPVQITNAVANESTETIPSGAEDNTIESDSKQPSANDTTNGESNIEQKHYKRGYICAFVNVLADSLGSWLTKQHGVGMSTWSINLIRFGFAGITLIFISAGMRLRRRSQTTESKPNTSQEAECIDPSLAADSDRDAAVGKASAPQWFELPSLNRIGWLYITVGVGFVTFLCPALSNYALFQIALGVAVSLSSIGPLYGLLLDWPFKGKRPTMYGCVGVLLTIAGVIILCVWGTK